MSSAFEELPNEWDGGWWKTTPLTAVKHRLGDLAAAAAVIAQHFASPDWSFRLNEGSVTFQSREAGHEHEVITVFVDEGNALAREEGIHLHADPIVVAVELSALPPFQRRCVRDYLRATFGHLYRDPAAGRPKRHLQPRDKGHFFDILFLGEGPCDFVAERRTSDRISCMIERHSPTEAVVGNLPPVTQKSGLDLSDNPVFRD